MTAPAALEAFVDKRSREWVLLCALLARQMPPTRLEAADPGVPG